MRLKKVFCTTKRTRLHQLSDILTIAILSVIAGGNGWEDMELYGVSKQAWLSTFLALPNGIPSEDKYDESSSAFNQNNLKNALNFGLNNSSTIWVSR